MDPRLLQFYTQELAHVRDTGAEFAARFPKIASRLGMDATEVHDPYVERLLEGFAFLTARVQLRLHEEFPRFTEQLLNRISPNFLAPVPAMGVVQFNTHETDPALRKGLHVKAGTVLQSQVVKGVQTPCKFTVGHDLTLWPLKVESIEHGVFKGASGRSNIRSALHVTLRNAVQSTLSSIAINALDFHVSCADEYAYSLFERICYRTLRVGIRAQGQTQWQFLPPGAVQPLGLEDQHALLPADSRQFSGTRLLQEFFVFPQRFLFFQIQGLLPYLSTYAQQAFELALCFDNSNPELDRVVGIDSLALNCTPVVNLFEHSCDRVVLDERQHESHVQPNRSKPLDFEVHSVISVQGHGPKGVHALPALYSNAGERGAEFPQYMSRRVPTLPSDKQAREGGRSSYTGSEVYLGLTHSTGELIANHGIGQLAVRAVCTNRDLPLLMPVGQGTTDLMWPGNLPLKSIRFLRGPSRPKAPVHNGQACWQLIEHLSLNYLGLIDESQEAHGAAAIAQLLSLHADPAQSAHQQMVRAIQGVQSRVVVSRIFRQGRPAVVRGIQVRVVVDELAMQGMGIAVLGSVLARYLASHVSVNSFVQTQVRALQTDAVIDFPAMSGNRPLL